MTIWKRLGGAALLSVFTAAAAWAQAPALNVRMGLWEVTSTIKIGGDMPGIDTSKMTPQQRAQMEAAMQQMMGTHTAVTKSCMTKDKFNAADFMGNNDDKNCKQQITTNTATALEATVSCTGEHPMTATMHIDAVSQTAVKATFKSTNTEQGKTMNVNGDLAGKWLAADCGDVK
jgi:hypothetical protein